MRYNAIPYVIYTNPEVAGVGETEESAREKGMEVDVANVSMRYSGRYLAENEGGDGICKVLVEKKTRRLVGVHMIGNYASEIIYGAGAMIEMEMRVDDIKEIVFPHPTVSEVIREGLFFSRSIEIYKFPKNPILGAGCVPNQKDIPQRKRNTCHSRGCVPLPYTQNKG